MAEFMDAVQVNKKRKRKLSDKGYETLISKVRKRPCLWDDCHADFKNSTVTKKLWDEVGSSLNLPGDEARKKWKNLKDTFRKYLQKLAPKSGSSAVPLECKWKFFTQMLFVKAIVFPDCTIGNPTQQSNDDDESSDYDDRKLCEPELKESESRRCDTPVRSINASSTAVVNGDGLSKPIVSKVHQENYVDNRWVDLEDRKAETHLSAQQHRDNEDGDYHFLLSLLPFIRELCPVQKLQLRTKIQNCVTEAYVNYKTPQNPT